LESDHNYGLSIENIGYKDCLDCLKENRLHCVSPVISIQGTSTVYVFVGNSFGLLPCRQPRDIPDFDMKF